MKMPNRAASIKKDVSHRQAVKKKWDRHCKYASDDELRAAIEAGEAVQFETKADFVAKEDGDNWIRLLDEGVVVDGGDWVFCVIEKGVLKKFYDELPETFEGYIDKDHIPAIYLGKYTKSDLRLVNLPDERYALEVNLKLDKSLYAVQDLLKEKQHNAVSVEMFTKADEYAKVSKITGMSEKEATEKFGWDYLVPIVNDLAIEGFAVCKAPKNANSYKDGLLENASLSEGEEMNEEEKKRLAKLQAEQNAENAEAEKAEDGNDNKEEDNNGVTEENLGDGCKVGVEEKEGKKVEAKAVENEDQKEVEPETPAGQMTDGQFNELKEAITALKEEIKDKNAKIVELEAQLAEKKESEKGATMSTSDRIAELLNFATAAEPVEGESGDKGQTTSKLSEAEAIEEHYRQLFENN